MMNLQKTAARSKVGPFEPMREEVRENLQNLERMNPRSAVSEVIIPFDLIPLWRDGS